MPISGKLRKKTHTSGASIHQTTLKNQSIQRVHLLAGELGELTAQSKFD